MAQFYEMPAISPTMEMGTLVQWKVGEGQAFQSSAVLAEIGTDKANMEAEIFDAGVLLKHLVAEGDEVPPGYPIAIWGKEGEDPGPLLAEFEKRKASKDTKPANDAEAQAPTPAVDDAPSDPRANPKDTADERAPETTGVKPDSQPKPDPGPQAEPAAQIAVQKETATVRRDWMGKEIHHLFSDPPGDLRFGATSAATGANGVEAPRSSPLARKIASDLGVDLKGVTGTGPGGRIVAKDVEDAPRRAPAAPAPASAPPAATGRPDAQVRNSPMRKTIAKRLLESHQQIPTFFLTATFDARGFVDLRDDLKDKVPDLKVSYNDLLVLGVARALREHPEVNASWSDKEIVRHGRVDIGIAVAMPDGLITPVVRNADRKGLSEVATEIRELAKRARDQKLAPEEYTGATFTISNLGMMDIEHFTAIINPPEAAILAVGSIDQIPVVVDGEIEPGWRMKVTMTCDHRIIDGAVGAAFLKTLRKYVESPWLLLV